MKRTANVTTKITMKIAAVACLLAAPMVAQKVQPEPADLAEAARLIRLANPLLEPSSPGFVKRVEKVSRGLSGYRQTYRKNDGAYWDPHVEHGKNGGWITVMPDAYAAAYVYLDQLTANKQLLQPAGEIAPDDMIYWLGTAIRTWEMAEMEGKWFFSDYLPNMEIPERFAVVRNTLVPLFLSLGDGLAQQIEAKRAANPKDPEIEEMLRSVDTARSAAYIVDSAFFRIRAQYDKRKAG
jgi:hypothetical protein